MRRRGHTVPFVPSPPPPQKLHSNTALHVVNVFHFFSFLNLGDFFVFRVFFMYLLEFKKLGVTVYALKETSENVWCEMKELCSLSTSLGVLIHSSILAFSPNCSLIFVLISKMHFYSNFCALHMSAVMSARQSSLPTTA